MLQGTRQFKVSTRQDQDSDAKETLLSVNMDGCSEDIAVGLACQHLVVRLQGSWRNRGIPSTATVNMKDYTPGSRNGGGMTVEQAIEQVAQNPVERAKLIAQLQAMK